jgi:hypothetical protein
MIERLLLPSAIVLAALIMATTFRFDVVPHESGSVVVHDRWTNRVTICGAVRSGDEDKAKCYRYPSASSFHSLTSSAQ